MKRKQQKNKRVYLPSSLDFGLKPFIMKMVAESLAIHFFIFFKYNSFF